MGDPDDDDDLDDDDDVHQVGEQGGSVDVTPEIRAENGPICGYRIVNPHKGKIPFEVIVIMLRIIILMKRMIMVTMLD